MRAKLAIMYSVAVFNVLIFCFVCVEWDSPPPIVLLPAVMGAACSYIAIRSLIRGRRGSVTVVAGMASILATLVELALVTFVFLVGPLVA
jgi:hypothetical protein